MTKPHVSTDAGRWLRERGKGWTGGAKELRSQRPRRKRAKVPLIESVREYVLANRSHTGAECLFVPGSATSFPASVDFCGSQISAARYMCLLTHGAPKSEGMHARHLCGNGHLSCINPNHIVWGSPGDNIADANKHRGLDNEQDRIHAID